MDMSKLNIVRLAPVASSGRIGFRRAFCIAVALVLQPDPRLAAATRGFCTRCEFIGSIRYRFAIITHESSSTGAIVNNANSFKKLSASPSSAIAMFTPLRYDSLAYLVVNRAWPKFVDRDMLAPFIFDDFDNPR
ncbi:hypothetical protein BCR44DRAFT_1018242 [Catenaria anguillulae PL171]|uniref:Uncharacterized protein n=1 Tax=Catenaria anguillulae PL171 TaxID=765915 RepID=A0A1Y2H8V8_9FUNG|nr:hypothetical protein BCR44DRAFT_1018242 [Catenaria anguillulae PL171]